VTVQCLLKYDETNSADESPSALEELHNIRLQSRHSNQSINQLIYSATNDQLKASYKS